jgi:hypothetical protein
MSCAIDDISASDLCFDMFRQCLRWIRCPVVGHYEGASRGQFDIGTLSSSMFGTSSMTYAPSLPKCVFALDGYSRLMLRARL